MSFRRYPAGCARWTLRYCGDGRGKLKHDEAAALISKRPAVHRLCYGVFLQSPLWISEDILAVPLLPMGFEPEFEYVVDYLCQFHGVELSPKDVEVGLAQRNQALPVITVIHFHKSSATPEQMEARSRESLERAEQIIAWATGDRLTEFAYITVNKDTYFRMVPPHSRRRTRLGFGNTGDDLKQSVDRLREAANEDPRFAFAMSLFADATHEPNPLFRACRLFTVLESLAYSLKGEGIGSRRAVKIMLGLNDGAKSLVQVDNRQISYDRIEIAGRLRDKFFHGVPFLASDLVEEARQVFYLIEHYPAKIADALLGDCELALARWANDASPARDAAKARSGM